MVVAVKVYDGIVLAADSATAVPLKDQATGNVVGHQVWNNADKIFHLHRDLPIGLATWGGGHIEAASISALAKDLRRRMMGRDPSHGDWSLEADNYTLEQVADRLVEFMHGELYSKTAPADAQVIGFFLAGYSSGNRHPEGWLITLADPAVAPTPAKVWDMKDVGWRAFGQPDTIARLLNGFAPSLQQAVDPLVPAAKKAAMKAAFDAEGRAAVVAPMPFADAIDLPRFCAQVTIGYTRFLPGPDLVGGPIDIAAISRHEGFKWTDRKHYYPQDLNPRRPHDHDQ